MKAQQLPDGWTELNVLAVFDRRVGRARIATIAALAVAAFAVPGLPSGTTVGLVLTIAAVVAIAIEELIGIERVGLARITQDHITSLLIASFVPDMWAAAALVVVGNCIWWTVRSATRASNAVILASLSAVICLGAWIKPQGWLEACIVTVALTILYYFLSINLRQALHDNEEDLAQALSTSGAIVHISDAETGQAESISGPIESLVGWTAKEWLHADLHDLIHPDDRETFALNPSELVQDEVLDRRGRFRRSDGSYAWLRDVSRVVVTADGTVRLRGFTMDVTEIEHAQALIRRQAETDELTGLANRSVLVAELEQRLVEGSPFALALLDLDRFKNINDTLGHSFGDAVLIEVGRRLRRLGRASDTVVRLGGDEFALIIANLRDDDAATLLARRVAKECGRAMSLQGVTISTAASIGIALAPRDGADVQTLMRHADIAMYEAKRERKSYQIFDVDIKRAPLEDVTLSGSIDAALDNDEFVLHFQPKVNIHTGEVMGFEGLARWNHPEFGLLTPNRFIHLVTLSNHSQAFANRVIALGAQFAAQCAAAGYQVPIAINVSARSLFDDSLPERTASILERNQLDPSLLIVEITEHDIMNKTAADSRVLFRLMQLGMALSIDDFGTGYSSLARLVDLPISEIKIDRRFVSRALQHEKDAIIVRTIIDLARNLKLDVIAEGVETEAEAELLKSFGCNRAQGFLYARPAPVEEALQLLGHQLGGAPVSSPPAAITPAFPSPKPQQA